MPRESISSNHFSVDQQLADAVGCLTDEQRAAFDAEFPEWANATWSMSHVDTDAMGLDPEWTSWIIDWIEANTDIYWEDGEPWIKAQGLRT